MEPTFSRGDILFLTNFAHEPYNTGDIVVYKIPGVPTPIVHRVLETHDAVPPGQNKIFNPGYDKKSSDLKKISTVLIEMNI